MKKQLMLTALLSGVLLSSAIAVAEHNPANYPDNVPFMGDWVGKWVVGEEKHPELAACVVGMGDDEYQITLVPKLYVRTPPVLTITVKAEGDILRYDDGNHWGEIKGDRFTGGRHDDDNSSFQLQPYKLEPSSMGAKPPRKAIVLIDEDFEEWRRFPRGVSWDILEGGILQANPRLGSIETKRRFGDCRLHLEFRLPYLPEKRGQDRANSGVFLQDMYEVQILDSYGLPGYWNECGAIYRISAPYLNMCLPPLQWQTYDIEFRAARFDREGNLTENARMTVVHNGVLIQKDLEMPRGTSGHAKKPPALPRERPDAIRLQSHENCVQFRNIWVEEL